MFHFRYNVHVVLNILQSIESFSSGQSTTLYAHSGELYASMKLEDQLSEDTPYGRLVLQSVSKVYLTKYVSGTKNPEKVILLGFFLR